MKTGFSSCASVKGRVLSEQNHCDCRKAEKKTNTCTTYHNYLKRIVIAFNTCSYSALFWVVRKEKNICISEAYYLLEQEKCLSEKQFINCLKSYKVIYLDKI